MPDRKETRSAMHSDADRAFVEMNARLYGYSPEDVTKLYDAYGPYATDLFRTALHLPLNIRSVMNPTLTSAENFSITPATKDLLDTANGNKPRLTNEQIARIVNKPEMEVAANIAEYRKQEEARKQIDATYQTISGGQNKPSTSVESLLAAGVTPEDFQAVFEQDETLAFNIGKSPSNNAIVDAAAHTNNGAANGNCGVGTKEVCDTVPGNPTSKALYTSTPAYAIAEGIPADGASGYYARLEQSGNYVILTKPNEACVDTTNIPNDKKRQYIKDHRHDQKNKAAAARMCEFTDQLPRGTIITWDNHTIVENGIVKPLGGGNGITYGHVCIKTEDPSSKGKKYKCDGQQENPHSAGWYGKNIHMCYNIDSQVPAEYAKMLIDHAQQRTGQCLNVEENRKAYEAGQRASRSAQRTRTTTQQRSKTTTRQRQTTTRRRQTTTRRSTGRGGR